MYKVFLDDKKIIVTNKLKKSYKRKYKIFRANELAVKDFIQKIEKYKKGKFVFYIEKENAYFEDFTREFILIQAGGGVVRNAKGEILFIKRRAKWDLPKGKLEAKEHLNTCAQREVEEETGIDSLQVLGLRTVTYHIYKQASQYCLKETFWYNMYSEYEKELTPQAEEDIEECSWQAPKKLKKLLKNSFSSLREVFKGEY